MDEITAKLREKLASESKWVVTFLGLLAFVVASLAMSVYFGEYEFNKRVFGYAVSTERKNVTCFEGFEKVAHKFIYPADEGAKHHAELVSAVGSDAVNIVEFERLKIRGAIRTDFILSAEIIVLTLGTVAAESLSVQLGVMLGIALLVTVGVYGLVAGIVKLDDLGLYMVRKPDAASLTKKAGRGIVMAAPKLMKILSVVGTLAMFLVGGGILVHGLPLLHHFVEQLTVDMDALLHWLVPVLLDGLVGIVAGAVVLAIVESGKRLLGRAH